MPPHKYRVNFYGTRTYEFVDGDDLKEFVTSAVASSLDAMCDGDPEAYRSVYYALESLHRKKRLAVADLPSSTWSILNRHVNEEESSSGSSSEDDDDDDSSDTDSSSGSEDEDDYENDVDAGSSSSSSSAASSSSSAGAPRRRFRRFRSCLAEPGIMRATSATPRAPGVSAARMRTLRPRYASPRPGTTARALYGVKDPAALSSLLEFDATDDESWLSGAFIDFVFGIFAKRYNSGIAFLPTAFAAHELKRAGVGQLADLRITDVLGIAIDPTVVRQLAFCFNVNDNHWTMIRVVIRPTKELSLFEPMGLPQSRKTKNPGAAGNGVSTRNFPRRLLQWLESVWPTTSGLGWGEMAVSAIKKRQQLTGFDCGVACLLYAEKLGLGMDRQHIARSTNQRHITTYRQLLQDMMANAGL